MVTVVVPGPEVLGPEKARSYDLATSYLGGLLTYYHVSMRRVSSAQATSNGAGTKTESRSSGTTNGPPLQSFQRTRVEAASSRKEDSENIAVVH